MELTDTDEGRNGSDKEPKKSATKCNSNTRLAAALSKIRATNCDYLAESL